MLDLPPDAQSATITLSHPLGLHLRIGKDVVQAADGYAAQIQVQNLTRESPVVNARSILQLMQLQARQGHRLRLVASGPDAAQAIAALCAVLAPDSALAGAGHDEPLPSTSPPQTAP